MRRSNRDFHTSLKRWHKRRARDRRPAVEGLEDRALMSAAHDLAVHDHLVPDIKKPVAGYQQTNLVSDIGGVAQITDSSLVNPWGIAFSTTGSGSPVWVSDEGTGVATIYTVSLTDTVTKSSLTVTIPTEGSSAPGKPTGQVFNTTTDFSIPGPSGPVVASFIFDTLQGTIEAWNPGSSGGTSSAVIMVNNSSTAVYTGLAAGNSGGVNYLYAANGGTSPGIQVFNGSFASVTLAGNFVDPKLHKGFTPYNIVNIGGELFVTYENSSRGGAVAEFNTDGTFVKQIASNTKKGNLNSPWGVTVSPSGFGKFSNDLLVGNFGSGRIDAYTMKGRFLGQLANTAKKPITIPGLWTLAFGDGLKAGPTTSLLFTAGIDNQTHGLFGALQSVSGEEVIRSRVRPISPDRAPAGESRRIRVSPRVSGASWSRSTHDPVPELQGFVQGRLSAGKLSFAHHEYAHSVENIFQKEVPAQRLSHPGVHRILLRGSRVL